MPEITIIYYWLVAGVVFLALEAFGMPGIGFFFAGLGALVTAIALSAGWLAEDMLVPQFAVALAVAVASGAFLWRPIQKFFPRSSEGKGYSDLIGSTAAVTGAGLRRGEEGSVTWSGTIMKAELAEDTPVDSLPGGAHVIICGVVGAKLFVKPKA